MTGDVIEQAAWVLREATDNGADRTEDYARALADAGLLCQEPPTSPDLSTSLTRVEVIDRHGSAYTAWDVTDVVLHVQDGGRTLKVFHAGEGLLRPEPPTRDEIARVIDPAIYADVHAPMGDAWAASKRAAAAVLALWEGRKR